MNTASVVFDLVRALLDVILEYVSVEMAQTLLSEQAVARANRIADAAEAAKLAANK